MSAFIMVFMVIIHYKSYVEVLFEVMVAPAQSFLLTTLSPLSICLSLFNSIILSIHLI